MMKNLLYIIAVFSVLVSCTEEKLEVVSPSTGQEIKFSANLSNGKTNSRTIYGDAVKDDNGNETAYKVNWVDGDNITVYGTTCSVRQANYKVNPGKDTNGNNSNYASSLEKTGDAGVQWGEEEASDFIAVYPAVDEDAFYMHKDKDENGDEYDNGNVSVYTSIRQIQTNNFKLVGNTWIGTPYQESTETMVDALMYAWSPGVNSEKTGGVVDLNFKPFSTVLKFTLDGWDVVEGTLDVPFSIQTITIKSPEAPIAGSCEFYFEKGKNIPEVKGGEYDDVIIQPKSLVVSKNQKIEFNVFTIPYASNMSEESVWVVVVEGILGGNWVSKEFHITPSSVQELTPGEIHKINIPTLPLEGNPINIAEYRATWMKYIPRNVYLSELSMPGAWYCMDNAYQGDGVTLDKLYAAGVRAFNIDCRISRTSGYGWGSYKWKDSDYPNNAYLVCSGTETGGSVLIGWSLGEGTYVQKAMSDLVQIAKNNPHELIAVIFTFAEKPKTETGVTNIYGTTNPVYITEQLNNILNTSGIKEYIYPDINSNTTIADLLTPDAKGNVRNIIVKINHSNDSFYSGDTFTMPSGIMCSYASMAMIEEYSNTYFENSYNSNITLTKDDTDYYSKMQSSPIYNGKKANDMTYYYCQAQKTFSSSGIPTLDNRKTAINDVLSQAKVVYDKSNHNALFQLGIGGMADSNWDGSSSTNTQQDLANELNPYIQAKIESMLNNGTVSPLGFVLMNYCISYQNLLDDILMFNTNMTLNANGDKEKWPEACGGNPYTTENVTPAPGT